MHLRWFAAHVRSRHEKAVAAHLAIRDIEFFLPEYTSQRKWSDRTVQIALPLFPGYVFVHVDALSHGLLRTPGVIRLVSDGRAWLDDQEISSLKVSTQKDYRPLPQSALTVGERVTIIRGPLCGHTGFLLREKNKKARVVVAVDLIQQAMSVELDMDALVPIQGRN